MNKGQEIRVSAKTLDKCLKQAAEKLQVSIDEVDHRIISQTKGGFLSFIGKRVDIVASVKKAQGKKPPGRSAGRSDKGGRRQSTRSESPDLPQEEMDALVEDLRAFCEDICGRMLDEEVTVHAVLEEKRLILDIQSESVTTLIAKHSKLPEALEHILRKKPRHLKRELPFRVFVDVGGVRRDRETELVDLAKDLSEKVHENKRPIVLNYKSPYDRKIIHMALDRDERVYTKSIGTGHNRKLMILPFKGDDQDYEESLS